MALFKCKMCGGELEPQPGTTTVECEYCGCTQTLPRLDDDRRARLYDRANQFRRDGQFDKAAGLFEEVLEEDRDDAEAYWSLVLCRYGVTYVDDPRSGTRVPTVNRVQYASILADADYKQALEHADPAQRALYEAEAARIGEIQRGILATASKEDPYDVFISYKETDEVKGGRTVDSVIATDIYEALTSAGMRVFLSRITLEGKLGNAYEPAIFSALHSAKVLIALGTTREHLEAPWVKNEWSRYLALVREDPSKVLIPVYRDMDPYDLPPEFGHLQAQDMGKVGAIQDLVRGVRKIVEPEAPKSAAPAPQPVVPRSTAATATVDSLLKRAFIFLEDSDWNSATSYADRVLDVDPECAEAYLVKYLASRELPGRRHLPDELLPPCCAEVDSNYERAVRYASPQLKRELDGYAAEVLDRARRKLSEARALADGACEDPERLQRVATVLRDIDCFDWDVPDIDQGIAALEKDLDARIEVAKARQELAKTIENAGNARSADLRKVQQRLQGVLGNRPDCSDDFDQLQRLIGDAVARERAKAEEAERQAKEAQRQAELQAEKERREAALAKCAPGWVAGIWNTIIVLMYLSCVLSFCSSTSMTPTEASLSIVATFLILYPMFYKKRIKAVHPGWFPMPTAARWIVCWLAAGIIISLVG